MRFWRHAPPSHRAVEDAPGCLLTAGLGEAPLFRQATFSIWTDVAAMNAYARSGPHLEAIKAAKDEEHFSESLFARFVPYDARGSWIGRSLELPELAA
jgi:spheroidene monooxygenase